MVRRQIPSGASRFRASGLVFGAAVLVYGGLAGPACQSSSTSTPAPTPVSTTTPPPPFDCSADDAGGWPMFSGNVCGARAGQATDPITPQTVSRLTVKWKFDASDDISATPAVVDGQVYFGDWGGMFYRLDAASGQVVWSKSVAEFIGLGSDAGAALGSDAGADGASGDGDVGASAPFDAAAANATPGLKLSTIPVVRDTPVVTGGLVIAGLINQGTLVAVKADTGDTAWTTTLDPHPYAVVTSSPVLDGNRVYVGVASAEEGASAVDPSYTCCSFRGSVAAVDVRTGKVLWQTPMIEDAVFRNAGGSLAGFSGAAVWSTPAVDRNRKLLYVTTGNNYSTPAAYSDGGTPVPAGDHIESILALDLDTGAIRWAQRMTTGDIWTFANFDGPDWDFGAGPNLLQVAMDGGVHDVVGAGQKSGVYWALDADTHALLWKTQVGPGGHLGGIHWGTATDGTRIYTGVNDEMGTPYKLGGSGAQAGTKTSVGSWAALDPATGAIDWQVANPTMTAPLNGASVNGPVAVVNGVLFGGSMDADGTMYALDARSGKVLWSFQSGATVYGGPAIADGVVYWGCGYPASRLVFGTPGHTLYAFAFGK